MLKSFYEYVERTCMASNFSQRDVRNRIRNHLKLVEGIENFPTRLECATKLSSLSNAELVAYDEYLNCTINAFQFRNLLKEGDRFSEKLPYDNR